MFSQGPIQKVYIFRQEPERSRFKLAESYECRHAQIELWLDESKSTPVRMKMKY
jgi:hypothetical protein